MIHACGYRDVRFPLDDRARLLKLLVASYVGFMIMYLCGFRATSSISVSAIMTLPYGNSVTNTREYVKKRMLAQVIGVAVTYPIYLIFFIWAVDVIPPSQKWALSMTLSLAITAFINRKCKLKIADITMLIPGYLVLLMTPGYSLYPVMRPIYVLLGIAIGYVLNVRFFSPHYGKIVDQQLEEARRHLEPLLVSGRREPVPGETLSLVTAALDGVDTHLQFLKQDMQRCAKYRPYVDRLPRMEGQVEAARAAVTALRYLADTQGLSPDFLEIYLAALSDCAQAHLSLLEGQPRMAVEPVLPSTADHREIRALACLLEYSAVLARQAPCTAVV